VTRTATYMKRKLAARAVLARHNGVVFDHGPKELPIAIVRPRAPAARAAALVGDLQRWIALRWEWLRPRTVPVAFAALGMVVAVLSTDFLAHDHGHHLRPHVEMIRVAR
jgi:hypothetical protein